MNKAPRGAMSSPFTNDMKNDLAGLGFDTIGTDNNPIRFEEFTMSEVKDIFELLSTIGKPERGNINEIFTTIKDVKLVIKKIK